MRKTRSTAFVPGVHMESPDEERLRWQLNFEKRRNDYLEGLITMYRSEHIHLMRLITQDPTIEGLIQAFPEICRAIKFAATADPPDGRKDEFQITPLTDEERDQFWRAVGWTVPDGGSSDVSG